MADLDRRGSYVPRRTREARAQRLAVAGGGLAVLGVLGLILSVVGIGGVGLPILALILAAVCGLLFRRTVS